MQRKSSGIGVWVAILVTILLVGMMVVNLRTPVETPIKYTTIVGYFRTDRVQEYSLDLGSGDLHITKLDDKSENISYKVPNVNLFLTDVQEHIIEHNAANPDSPIEGDYVAASTLPWWVSFLPSLLLFGVMIGFWVYFMRQSRGASGAGVSGFGKAKAKDGLEGRRVTFADVAGIDEEKAELEEIVDFLRSPSKYNKLGARIPKGVLLVGPPGTGKTLLARAVAGEANVQFFSISGSDFVELYVGVGASRVRDLFEQAKKNAPSLIFIDEIDAAGRQRGAGVGGGHDEREQTLNQLLVEMDGFSANTGVIVMGATNRSDILDPALLRPGRFDRHVYVGYPDVKGREEILKIHVKNKPLAPDVDLASIARGTVGFTGADLENVLNEAALLAARYNQKAITMENIDEATMKVTMGPEKTSQIITDKDKWITSYHEAGHAVASYFCKTQPPVHEISVVPRGMAAGYTLNRPDEDKLHIGRNYMYESIVVLLGGRVAEELTQDDISTGASNDLERATKTARDMVTRYGFSDTVGQVVYGTDDSQVFVGRDYGTGWQISDTIAAEIDNEVRRLIDRAYDQCKTILEDNMVKLSNVAQALMQQEKVDRETFERIMKGPATPELDIDTDDKDVFGDLSLSPL